MKKLITKIFRLFVFIHLSIAFFNSSIAQTIPGGVNFQAIARNASGIILSNTPVQVRVSVLDGSTNGAVLGSFTCKVSA